jgi:hypothetical protein
MEVDQRGYDHGPVNSTWQNHVVAPCRHIRSKQAARDVDHVPVLDIFWSYRLTVNSRPKVNRLGKLFTIDYARQMNIARAAVVTYSARLHNRLVHSRRAIKRVYARFIGKPGHGHGCLAVLQRDQHFIVIELAVVAADELILKIDDPFAGSCQFADKRETHLAVPANFLRLVRDALVGIGNLDHISGRKSYCSMRSWRIRQRRQRALAAAARQRGTNQKSENPENDSGVVNIAMNRLGACRSSILGKIFSGLHHAAYVLGAIAARQDKCVELSPRRQMGVSLNVRAGSVSPESTDKSRIRRYLRWGCPCGVDVGRGVAVGVGVGVAVALGVGVGVALGVGDGGGSPLTSGCG